MKRDPGNRAAHARDLTRREMLSLIGAAGAAALVRGSEPAAAHTGTGPSLSCVVTPAETQGPYFVDELLHRADIRGDPTDNAVKDGAPLRVKMTVHRIDGASCTPLTGAHVDLWQCDALGVYSDVRDFQGLFDTRGKKFLRGYQVTDRNGAAEFTTIYPGWYSGRTPHIHFKIRLFAERQKTYEFTSQLYFDDATTDGVYAQAPYNAKGPRDTRNKQDRIFTGPSADRTVRSNNGEQLMLQLSKDAQGYVGTFDIGLKLT
ncbi:MAG: intradiol ring-cleavage dioxygenase [Gemmatimonadetes bacterium]|nr:intradiol ring-cleavage dioxygenase [Gemmatimonadota bacterium]